MGEEDQAPSQNDQKQLVSVLLEKSLVVGDVWYLVDAKWMKSLKLYLGITGDPARGSHFHPGSIDNRSLLNLDNSIKNDLAEGSDYELVPEELWLKLVEWYGVSNQSIIARKVIQLKINYVIVEIYLVKLKCGNEFPAKPEAVMSLSRLTPMKSVDAELRARYNIDPSSDTRLWLKPGVSDVTYQVVDNMNKTLLELGATTDGVNYVIIESKETNASWSERSSECTKNKSMDSENNLSSYSNSKFSRMTAPYQPGLCGLTNLGNTCFMNSVIQCLSNCPPITEYFLARKHMEEVNQTNPLGMSGVLAISFGSLIEMMWSGKNSSAGPLQFKIQLGNFNPVFSGCQQHDSQELLTFLLDGLHEDLNRIKNKPYTEINDDSDREDKILAQEAWDRHRKRNDSIIVDTFHGLLKSRVVCPDCKKLSVTFDPFCNLSLPLPQKKDRVMSVTVVPFLESYQYYKCRLIVPRHGTIKDLCREVVVSSKSRVDPSCLLVVEMNKSHFHKFYSAEDSLDCIQDRDLISVYEMPALASPSDLYSPSKYLFIPVYLWEMNENSDKFDYDQLFGVPFFVKIPKKPITEALLRVSLLEQMQRHFNIPLLRNTTDAVKGLKNVEETMKEVWFKIFIKSTADRSQPSLIFSEDKSTDLIEMFDVEESPETFYGRHVMLLGFTKELKRDVYLEKPVEYLAERSYDYKQAREREKITIYDCLSLFTTCEKLGADDAWYCPTCKKHQRATKKFDLWDLPKILIVHLKRFSYTRLYRDKIDALVDCPLKYLDMSQYLIKKDRTPSMYNLIGVCNHFGGMGGGHYTANCKNKDLNEWFNFDDSSVERISEDRVLTPAAYVLFYMAADQ